MDDDGIWVCIKALVYSSIVVYAWHLDFKKGGQQESWLYSVHISCGLDDAITSDDAK